MLLQITFFFIWKRADYIEIVWSSNSAEKNHPLQQRHITLRGRRKWLFEYNYNRVAPTESKMLTSSWHWKGQLEEANYVLPFWVTDWTVKEFSWMHYVKFNLWPYCFSNVNLLNHSVQFKNTHAVSKYIQLQKPTLWRIFLKIKHGQFPYLDLLH